MGQKAGNISPAPGVVAPNAVPEDALVSQSARRLRSVSADHLPRNNGDPHVVSSGAYARTVSHLGGKSLLVFWFSRQHLRVIVCHSDRPKPLFVP